MPLPPFALAVSIRTILLLPNMSIHMWKSTSMRRTPGGEMWIEEDTSKASEEMQKLVGCSLELSFLVFFLALSRFEEYWCIH